MAAAREKQRAHRKKKMEGKTFVSLVEPESVESPETEMALEKIKVPINAKSALIQGGGRSMGMDID
jgi:large subunit ribosomal protein L24e